MTQIITDQGGNYQFTKLNLGPSVGTVLVPAQNVLSINSSGTYVLDPIYTLVQVNVAAAVVIVLPSCVQPTVPATAQPALFGLGAITINDVGGHAQAHPIQIQPAAGQTIMGLASIEISQNYGAATLFPISAQSLWSLVATQ